MKYVQKAIAAILLMAGVCLIADVAVDPDPQRFKIFMSVACMSLWVWFLP
jgi:hypothetical protein